jgi:hypothetical protein
MIATHKLNSHHCKEQLELAFFFARMNNDASLISLPLLLSYLQMYVLVYIIWKHPV